MCVLKAIFTELWGLFVDDGSLAFALVVWCGLSIWLLPRSGINAAADARILFLGCLSILLINVVGAARAKPR